jgi:hypothetical protein
LALFKYVLALALSVNQHHSKAHSYSKTRHHAAQVRPRPRNLRGQCLRLDPAFPVAPQFNRPYIQYYPSRDCPDTRRCFSPGQGAILDVDDHGVGAEGLELWLGGLVVTAPAAFNSSVFLSIRVCTSSDPTVMISAAVNTNENILLVREPDPPFGISARLWHPYVWRYRRKSSFAHHLAAEKGVTLQRVMNRSFADHSYYTGCFENKRHFTWHGNTVVSKVTRRSMSTEAADTIVYIQLFQ